MALSKLTRLALGRQAAARGHVEVVRALLVDGRADAGARDNYPIRWAAQNGHLEVCMLQIMRPHPRVTVASICPAERLSWKAEELYCTA
jgi:hypothetical protein